MAGVLKFVGVCLAICGFIIGIVLGNDMGRYSFDWGWCLVAWGAGAISLAFWFGFGTIIDYQEKMCKLLMKITHTEEDDIDSDKTKTEENTEDKTASYDGIAISLDSLVDRNITDTEESSD